MENIDYDILIKLGISAILGLIIGLERELKRKPVGLKTSLVISVVSCLLTIVSIESAYMFPDSDNVRITMDPLRLAAQIVSGIGFLGAGVILRRGNDSISGLTTAAMIWGAAGIGIAVGAGFFIEAFVGVALLIISVELVPYVMKFIGPKQLREKEISLQLFIREKIQIENAISFLMGRKYIIRRIRIKDLDNGDHLVQILVAVDYREKTTDVYDSVSNLDGVQKVEIESMGQ
ncbi:putative Mg2+ transporter-C (MgtC) family protein [Neobacillus niacini]|jgi:putative Mg2+ transporter-C (MgtC) family protein|uniref:MgtC/SapB family protein n=1 Tax=Neobacillus niacini TaxID=86668 RepID=UPI002788052D|nr:MgtC/SapB family protein [Neobacillus niacini]MDQ1001112.1 putative Mg2+ transporter-C (MgtC) family protein [Neobacillus niacini]